jgi:hypothetical protein
MNKGNPMTIGKAKMHSNWVLEDNCGALEMTYTPKKY